MPKRKNNNLPYQRSNSLELESKKSPFKRSLSSPNIQDKREILETILLRSYVKKKIELNKVGIGRLKSHQVNLKEPRELLINEGYIVLDVDFKDWSIEVNDKFMDDSISKGLIFGLWNNLNEKEEAILKKKESIEDLNEFLSGMSKEARLEDYPVLSSQFGISVTGREIKMLIESGYEKREGSPRNELFKLEFLTKGDNTFHVYLKKKGLERQLSIIDEEVVDFDKFKSQPTPIKKRKSSTDALPEETKRSAHKEIVIKAKGSRL